MKPTEILMNEHRVIERVLDCLEAIAAGARERRELDLEAAHDVLEVLGTFADRCHHAKEENVLFAALERRGIPRAVGPVAVMLSEHDVGRTLIARMRVALETNAVAGFAAAADEYVALLREHIAKEDGVLFPMAEAVLRDEDREQVLLEFARTEHSDLGPGTHERMLEIVDRLTRKFSLPERPASSLAELGCCHSCHHA